MIIRFGLLAALLLASACGGDSADGKQLSELDASERRELCEYAVELDRGTVGDECGPDGEPGEAEVQACIAELEQFPSSCKATVDQAKACLEAQAENPCGDDDEVPECAVLDC